MRLTTSDGRSVGRSTRSPLWAAALVVGALLLVFAADRATGATPVQHLYYLPIILAAVRFRMRGGVLSALSAILLYHVANPHLFTLKYEEPDLVQITLFLAVGMITAKMTRDADHLRRLAMTDDLTGLHNLRSFEARLIAMVREARRTHATLAVLVLDLDRLKSLNDQYGHLTGAEAVRTVGRIIGERLPSDAVGCRYGGDEFVIAIPRCTASRPTKSPTACAVPSMPARRSLRVVRLQPAPCPSASVASAPYLMAADRRKPRHPATSKRVKRCFARPTRRSTERRREGAIKSVSPEGDGERCLMRWVRYARSFSDGSARQTPLAICGACSRSGAPSGTGRAELRGRDRQDGRDGQDLSS